MFFELVGRENARGRAEAFFLARCSDFVKAEIVVCMFRFSVALHLPFVGTGAHLSSFKTHKQQKQHKSSINISSLTLASVFFGASVAHRRKWVGNVAALESIFRMNRGVGV